VRQETAEYAKSQLKEAREALDEAEALYEKKFVKGTVSRTYYACFHAVTAALVVRGLSSSKHSGVRSLFLKNFIKPGIFPQTYGSFYKNLLDRRHDADYGMLEESSPGEVGDWLVSARDFLREISAYVEEQLKKGS
jgi:uncharacterized protein (UPF0332 family)